MSTNIQVCIKIRPLISREVADNCKSLWYVEDTNIIQKDEATGRFSGDVFSFDHIFNESQTNNDVYNSVVRNLVQSALDGFNSTVFAYGQTSSGKTYTMLGDEKRKTLGIMHLAIDDLFDHMNKDSNRKYLTRCSYIEIYNEKINDLLNKNGKDLKVREDFKGIRLNVKEELVNESSEVFHLMKLGNKIRKIGCTDMNERSSRSHTIFKIIIQSTENGSEGSYQESHLNFVDLAGSERVGHMQLKGERHLEGVHINMSLTTLGMVIRKLSENESFINYRDSKLTRLLQSALGGNSKTLVIAAVTLAAADETKSTLEFARRAKAVQNKPIKNQMVTDKDQMKEYEKLLKKYENDLKNAEVDRQNKTKIIAQLQNKVKHISVFMPTTIKPMPQLFNMSARRRHTLAYDLPRGSCVPYTDLHMLSEEEEDFEMTDATTERDLILQSRLSGDSEFSEEDENTHSQIQIDKETQTSFTENEANWNFLDESLTANTTLLPEAFTRRHSRNASINTNDTLWNKTFSDIEERDNTFEFKELREHNHNLQSQLVDLIAENNNLRKQKDTDFTEMNLLVLNARKEKQQACEILEAEILGLKQSLAAIRNTSSCSDYSLQQVLSEKARLETELKNLQNDSDFILSNTTKNFNKKIQLLTEEIDRLHKNTNSSPDREKNDLLNSFSKLQEDLLQTTEKCKTLEQDLKDSKQEKDVLKLKLERIDKNNAELYIDISNKKNESEKLQGEIKKFEYEREILTNTVAEKVSQIAILTKENKNIEEKCSNLQYSLESQLLEYKKSLDSLQQEIINTQQELLNESKKNVILLEKYKGLEGEYKSLNEDNELLSNKCKDLITEKTNVYLKYEIVKDKIKDLNIKYENIVVEKHQLNLENKNFKQNQNDFAKLQNEREILANTISEKEGEIEALIERINVFEEKYSNLQFSLEKQSSEVTNTQKDLADETNKNAMLSKEFKELRAEYNSLKDENEILSNRCKDLTQEKINVCLKYEIVKDELTDLNIKYEKLEVENQHLNSENENFKHKQESISSQLASLVKSNEDLAFKYQNLKKGKENISINEISNTATLNKRDRSLRENNGFQEPLEVKEDELRAKFQALCKELSECKDNIKALEDERDSLMQEYDQKMFDQIDEYEALKSTMLKKEQELLKLLLVLQNILIEDVPGPIDQNTPVRDSFRDNDLVLSFRRLSYSVEVCKMLEGSKSEDLSMSKDKSRLSQVHETFKTQADDSKFDRDSGLQKTEELESTIEELNSKIALLSNENVQLQKDCQALESKLQSLRADRDVFVQQSKQLETTVEQLNSKITSLSYENDHLKNDSHTVEKKLQSLRSERDAALQKTEQLEATITLLESNLALLNSENEELKKECEEVSRKLQSFRLDRDAALKKTEQFEATVQQLELNTTVLNNENELLKKDVEEVMNKIQSLRLDRDVALQDTEKMETTIKLLESNITLLSNDKQQLKKEVETQIQSLKLDRDAALQKAEQFKETIQILDSNVTELQNENEQLKNDSEEIREQLQRLVHDQDQKLSQIKELDENVLELQCRLNSVSTENNNIKQKYDALEKERDALTAVNIQLKSSLSKLTVEISSLKTMREDQIDINVVSDVTKSDEVKLLKEEIEEKNRRIVHQDAEIFKKRFEEQELISENNKLQLLRIDDEKKITEMKSLLYERDSEITKLQNRVVEIEREYSLKIEKIMTEQKMIVPSPDPSKEVSTTATGFLNVNESSCSRRRSFPDISVLRAEIETLKQNNIELNEENIEFSVHVQAQDNRIRELQEQCLRAEEKVNTYEKLTEELRSEKYKLEKMIRERDSEIVKYTTKCYDLKLHYSSKVDQYEEELKRLKKKANLENKKTSKEECGVQVDTMDYSKLLSKYGDIKRIARLRLADIEELKKKLSIASNAIVNSK